MKSLLLTLLLAAADDTPFAGKWDILNDIGGTSVDQTCTFTQSGNELAGSCETQRGVVKVSGKADGKKVNWTYKSQSNEGLLTVTYEGTLDSKPGVTRITGSVLVEEMGIRGTFTANQAK